MGASSESIAVLLPTETVACLFYQSGYQEICREQYGQYSHAATETKRYCVTIEVSSLGKFIEYINDGTNILNNKTP